MRAVDSTQRVPQRGCLLPALLLACLMGAGCDDAGDAPAPVTGEAELLAQPEGAVLVEVDGEPITEAQLDAAMRRAPADANPAEVLERLIELQIVARRALEAGLGEGSATRLAQRRAMTQRLLELEVESAEPVSDAMVRKAYDEFAMEFFVPELVTVSHLLVRLPEAAQSEARVAEAVALAGELRQALLDASQGGVASREALDALVAPANVRGPFVVHAEHDLTFPRRAVAPLAGRPPRYPTMVEPFAEAAFALSEAEPLSAPVLSPFGVHLIVLRERTAAERPPFDEVSVLIRDDLTRRRRARAVESLLGQLRSRARIEVDEEPILDLAERAGQ